MTDPDDILTRLVERITAKFAPSLNTGSAMDALILVAEAVRELRAELEVPLDANPAAD